MKLGEIVIERLTGRRGMVIAIANHEDQQVTCRFEDGRLEDRHGFEVAPVPHVVLWPTIGRLFAWFWQLLAFVPREPPSRPRLGTSPGTDEPAPQHFQRNG